MRKSSLLAAVAAALGSVSGVGAIALTPTSRAVAADRRENHISTASPESSVWNYPTGPGWTVAQVRRMAQKRINKNRNKLSRRK
jgi:hypothetical protein